MLQNKNSTLDFSGQLIYAVLTSVDIHRFRKIITRILYARLFLWDLKRGVPKQEFGNNIYWTIINMEFYLILNLLIYRFVLIYFINYFTKIKSCGPFGSEHSLH